MSSSDSPETSPPQPHRPRTLRFVVLFMAFVLVLLAGYRYTVGSRLNDWYLFQVGMHTTWVLDHVGYRARLEDDSLKLDPARVRGQLLAWEQGLDALPPEMQQTLASHALSRWERYRYRLLNSRHNKSNLSLGPRVSFVLRPGLLVRIQESEQERTRLRELDPGDPSLAGLDQHVAELRQQQAAIPKGPEGKKQLVGNAFTFVIVPECGAVEVMAIFFAAVMAFPAPFTRRLLGILLGLPLMYCINVLRLSCLGVIGALTNSGEWFDFAHNYVWQAIYIVFVVAIWLAWVEYIVRRRRPWKNAPAAA